MTRESDWKEIVDTIAAVKQTSDFKLYAWCLLTNHIHLLIEVGSVPLSRVMQRIKGSWAKRFNAQRRRKGHVFQGRFDSALCVDDAYFKWLLRYIHFNPVKAGLAGRPEDWGWSSYREYFAEDGERLADTEWPLSLFASACRPARDLFREFVLQGFDDKREPSPMADSLAPTPAVDKSSYFGCPRPKLTEIAGEVATQMGVGASAIFSSSRIRQLSAARRIFAARAAASGYGIAELARALTSSKAAVSLMLRQSSLPTRSGTQAPAASFERINSQQDGEIPPVQ